MSTTLRSIVTSIVVFITFGDVLLDESTQLNKVIDIFYKLFKDKYRTKLIGGGKEPIYQPSDATHPYHQIIFTNDYVSSALHEVAHWCVAGIKRRQLIDYGYWYSPDGRSMDEQKLFEKAEVKPQALEWIFSTAIGIKFRVSADNLEAGQSVSEEFKRAIHSQVGVYCNNGMGERPLAFAKALSDTFGNTRALSFKSYALNAL